MPHKAEYTVKPSIHLASGTPREFVAWRCLAALLPADELLELIWQLPRAYHFMLPFDVLTPTKQQRAVLMQLGARTLQDVVRQTPARLKEKGLHHTSIQSLQVKLERLELSLSK